MEKLGTLECEIRDALRDARSLLNAQIRDATQAIDLLKRLFNLADAAADAQYPLSEQFLETAADELERRIGLFKRLNPSAVT